ncbi:molybdenum cofactor guanylyltransferase [Paenibacillus sp. 1001270B_150601_E10]|uniref:molybdenum cofactor guanylyltransferase n=1 Tax=Paenibacillus sp. 1001270B_150601_E10 TaxID=2787079 RepID=UPI00189F9C9E|nr:molybdenum cofactor guanylyltransferase [Paenibacillus sp. 1001270B_150601_E10]
MDGIIGIVLAGGMSSRFGSPKALAKLQGKLYYELACEAMSAIAERIVIVSRPEFRSQLQGNADVIEDDPDFAGCGPLAGIYSVMERYPAQLYAVLPCDMPYLTGDVLEALAASYKGEDVLAVSFAGKDHPLVGLYASTMMEPIQTALKQERYAVMKLLQTVNTRFVKGEEILPDQEQGMWTFKNINVPLE